MYIVTVSAIQRKYIKDNGYTYIRADATRYKDYDSAYSAARQCDYRMKAITIVKVSV
jgi:hypothetical protein